MLVSIHFFANRLNSGGDNIRCVCQAVAAVFPQLETPKIPKNVPVACKEMVGIPTLSRKMCWFVFCGKNTI